MCKSSCVSPHPLSHQYKLEHSENFWTNIYIKNRLDKLYKLRNGTYNYLNNILLLGHWVVFPPAETLVYLM